MRRFLIALALLPSTALAEVPTPIHKPWTEPQKAVALDYGIEACKSLGYVRKMPYSEVFDFRRKAIQEYQVRTGKSSRDVEWEFAEASLDLNKQFTTGTESIRQAFCRNLKYYFPNAFE